MFGKRVGNSSESAEQAILHGLKATIWDTILDARLTEPRTKILVHTDIDGEEIHRQFFMRPSGEFVMLMAKFDEDWERWKCILFRNAASALPKDYELKLLTEKEKMDLHNQLYHI